MRRIGQRTDPGAIVRGPESLIPAAFPRGRPEPAAWGHGKRAPPRASVEITRDPSGCWPRPRGYDRAARLVMRAAAWSWRDVLWQRGRGLADALRARRRRARRPRLGRSPQSTAPSWSVASRALPLAVRHRECSGDAVTVPVAVPGPGRICSPATSVSAGAWESETRRDRGSRERGHLAVV